MHTPLKIVVVSSIALALAACGSPKDANKSNFSKAIQAYLDTQHGLCASLPAKEMPFSVPNKDFFGEKKRADALVDAGLLSKRDTEVKPSYAFKMEPGTEYQITDLGKKYLIEETAGGRGQGKAFCTGKYVIVDVDNFSEPADMMGEKASRVNFRYKLKDGADWAKTESLSAVYNGFSKDTKGDIQDKAYLVLTNNGWMHERLFRKNS